jgi:hypothetical protein
MVPGMTMRTRKGRSIVGDEAGGTLVLALAYMLIVGSIMGSIGGWIVNDLHDSTQFKAARAEQTALNSAIEVATQSIRYSPLLAAGQSQTLATPSSPGYCWGSAAPSELTTSGGQAVSVWCSTVWNPTSTTTRVVTMAACPSTTTGSACAASPLLVTVVTFDDYPTPQGTPTSSECTSTCGTVMSIDSWVWR